MARMVGTVTRGTTNPNRLRRCDRWIAATCRGLLRAASPAPIVVDLGYGASGITAWELHERLSRVRPDVEVVGLEIDPERVRAAAPLTRPGLRFAAGGFEVPLPGARRATVIRAFNVLRQYDEDQVAGAWARMTDRLTGDGLLVEGTCDEVGRLASWVAVDRAGPRSLTISLRLRDLARPGIVAERLPKALIHRNVEGEPIHAFLGALDRAWEVNAPLGSYGARQRFVAAVASLRAQWPLLDDEKRWRQGEFTVAWDAVAPAIR